LNAIWPFKKEDILSGNNVDGIGEHHASEVSQAQKDRPRDLTHMWNCTEFTVQWLRRLGIEGNEEMMVNAYKVSVRQEE
jgi:hypothetical protein